MVAASLVDEACDKLNVSIRGTKAVRDGKTGLLLMVGEGKGGPGPTEQNSQRGTRLWPSQSQFTPLSFSSSSHLT